LNDNEFIFKVGLGCNNESIDQGRSYANVTIDISQCFFSRHSLYDGNGGVIYVFGSPHSMDITNIMFYNCVCSNQGGAIYFSSSNSSLRMICANSCLCGIYKVGNFAHLLASKANQVEYLSISNCSHTTSGYNPVFLNLSYQRVDNTNSSMNNAIQVSGIQINSPSSSTSSFCTFSNNKVSDGICIFFASSSGTISMSFANIVHNNSPSIGVVFISGVGSKKMMYCIFHNNQNTLFREYQGSLELSHSFIDHSGSFSSLISESTSNNNSFTKRVTYQIQFFNSHHCYADIPLPQRTLEKSPMRSLEETIRRTNEETLVMTNKRTIDQTMRMTNKRTIDQTMVMTNDRTIDQTMRMTNDRTIDQTMGMTNKRTIDQTMRMTNKRTIDQTMGMTNKRTIDQTNRMTNDRTIDQTMRMTNDRTIDQTMRMTNKRTIDQTNRMTNDRTIDQTNRMTNDRTIDQTIDQTMRLTNDRTIDQTMRMTNDRTIDQTNRMTNDRTIDQTIDQTMRLTNDRTIDQTNRMTNDRTIDQTMGMTNDRTIVQTMSAIPTETIQRSFSPCLSRPLSTSQDQTFSPSQSIFVSSTNISLLPTSSNSNYQVLLPKRI